MTANAPYTAVPQRRRFRRPAIIAGLLLWAFVLCVARADELMDEGEHTNPNAKPQAPWREESVPAPVWPQAADLAKVQIDSVDFPFTLYLDTRTLQVGRDGVVRYTAVLESRSGARNVLYEGMHCATDTYRTYAFGSGGHAFQQMHSKWQPIMNQGTSHFRAELFRFYLCNATVGPRSRSDILHRIRYPGDIGR